MSSIYTLLLETYFYWQFSNKWSPDLLEEKVLDTKFVTSIRLIIFFMSVAHDTGVSFSIDTTLVQRQTGNKIRCLKNV